MQTPAKRFFTRVEAAAYLTQQGLPIAAGTLQKLASVGGGPKYRVVGRNALYEPAELDAWVEHSPVWQSATERKTR